MPTGIYIRTDEHNRKISKALKGKASWNEGLKGYVNKGSFPKGHQPICPFKKGYSNRKGQKHTPESKTKMSNTHKAKRQIQISLMNLKCVKSNNPLPMIEHNRRFGSWNKGKRFSLESRRRMSIGMKGRTPWNKGIETPLETKLKVSASRKGKCVGANNVMWKDGATQKKYKDFGKALKEMIRIRDGRKCQLCGTPEMELLIKLDIHHIDFNKENSSSDNLISLCHKCHSKTNHPKKRKYWINKLSQSKEDSCKK